MITTSPISLSLLYRAENKRFLTLKRTKTGGIQPMLNVACFVQSCLTDADFVIFSNYCLTGTRRKLRFFSVAPKEARNGYRCNMSEIWQSSMRYKAFLHLRGFSIWSAYRPQSTIRRKGKGRGDFTYPWRRTFQGGQKALPIFLPKVPLFPALSLKGTQRYIFLGKVLPDSGSFQGAFF